MKFKHTILSVIILFAAISSCIDQSYDISKLPKELIVAGDSITFPIGKIDTGLLKSFMKRQNIQYIEVQNDRYYLSYGDSINLPVPTKEELRVADFSVSTSSSILFVNGANTSSNITLPSDTISPFSRTNTIPVTTNSTILRVDSAEFSNGVSESIITLSLRLNQIQLVSGSYSIAFNMHVPAGFVLENLSGTAISTPYVISETKSDNSLISRTFKLRRFKKGANNLVLSYDGSITLKKNSIIRYSSTTPSVSISVSGNNLYVEALKGQLSYGPIKTRVRENLKELYSFFKNAGDVISFYDPFFTIQTKTNFSVPVIGTMDVSTKGGTPTVPSNLTFEIVPPASFNALKWNYFRLSQEPPVSISPNEIWQQVSFRNYLKAKPDSLITDITYQSKPGSGSIDNPHFIRNNSIGKAYYNFKLPISFNNDFQFSFCDTLHNIFTDEIKKYLFDLGSVYLTGDVVTTLPLNAEFSATILAENYATPPVTISSKVLYKATKGGVNRSPFKLEIKPGELAAMLHPRHFSAKIIIKSDESIQGIILKPSDFIHLENLKITKKGGIKVDL